MTAIHRHANRNLRNLRSVLLSKNIFVLTALNVQPRKDTLSFSSLKMSLRESSYVRQFSGISLRLLLRNRR